MTRFYSLAAAFVVLLSLPTTSVCWPSVSPTTIQDLVPPPFRSTIPERILKAEVIVLGRIESIESEPVLAAAMLDDLYQSAFRIARLKIREGLRGAEGLLEVRVGFRPVNHPHHRHLELAVGDEGCFFLQRHPDRAFFLLQPPLAFRQGAKPEAIFLRSDSLGYAREVSLTHRCIRLLGNPKEGLTARETDDRLLTAALLVKRYRSAASTQTRVLWGTLNTEPIDATESRLILSALAESELTTRHSEADVSALGVFGQLGLGPADGWEQSFDRTKIAEQARAWLKKYASTYRVQQVLPWSRETRSHSALLVALVGIAPVPGSETSFWMTALLHHDILTSRPTTMRAPALSQQSPVGFGGRINSLPSDETTAKSSEFTLERKFMLFVGGGLASLAVLLYLAGKGRQMMVRRRHAASRTSSSTVAGLPQPTSAYVPEIGSQVGAGVKQVQERSG